MRKTTIGMCELFKKCFVNCFTNRLIITGVTTPPASTHAVDRYKFRTTTTTNGPQVYCTSASDCTPWFTPHNFIFTLQQRPTRVDSKQSSSHHGLIIWFAQIYRSTINMTPAALHKYVNDYKRDTCCSSSLASVQWDATVCGMDKTSSHGSSSLVQYVKHTGTHLLLLHPLWLAGIRSPALVEPPLVHLSSY